jgi:hypothetical protein
LYTDNGNENIPDISDIELGLFPNSKRVQSSENQNCFPPSFPGGVWIFVDHQMEVVECNTYDESQPIPRSPIKATGMGVSA